MATQTSNDRRAANCEEIKLLVELCKAGKLFEVQQWCAAGKPVAMPPPPKKGKRSRSPLEVAVERGFHSLVQVLLEAGAVQEPAEFGPALSLALQARRFDLVQLFVEHGFDPATVDMRDVFASWEPQIMKYFVEHGADLQTDLPFAVALCDRVRTALPIFKNCLRRTPELREQGNIALRYHCKEGNVKWASLMLWAGADPFEYGPASPYEGRNQIETSAVAVAALYKHFDIFELKPIRSRLQGHRDVLPYLVRGEGANLLKRLLEQGLDPNDQENGGCTAIESCLHHFHWVSPGSYSFDWGNRNDRPIDSYETRELMRVIHLLAKHGGRWVPNEWEIKHTRKTLTRLTADYAVEFAWIMAKYQACTVDCLTELFRTPTIQRHVKQHEGRLREILAQWQEVS